MSKLSVFTASVLLVTTPPMLVYPQNLSPNVFQVQKVNSEENKVNSDYVLSYDDMIRLFDEIESGELEKKCTPHKLEKIKQLLAFLASEGAIPDNSEESLSLDDDIEELLNGEDHSYQDAFSFAAPDEYQYMIIPAVLNGHGDVILCKSWAKKKWDQIRKFAKKHKKELIIGAIVVVATVTIVGVAAVAPAAAAVAGGAAVADSISSSEKKAEEVSEPSSAMAATHEAPILKSTIDDQVSSLKETIMQNQFFQPQNEENGQQNLSWEENGRVLGSLFAHESLNNIQNQIPYHAGLAQEIQDIHSKYTFPLQGVTDVSIGHSEIDRKFSTDYAYLFSNQEADVDLYQVRGERALEFGYYNQAVQDFGRAIEANPTNPISYLERGVAHFALGQYDLSLEDYKQFTFEAQKTYPLSIEEFSAGFTRGLPKGAYEAGKGLLLFLIDFVKDPIYTTWHTIEGFAMLALLARNDEWKIIGEMLVPEAFELVNQWNDLSSDERGELTAFALAKHGTNIFLPGTLSKLASMGLKSGPQLAAVFRKLQIAQDTLVLETATGIGNAAKIAEVVEAGQQTAFFAEELGVSAREMGQLKQAGKLEATLANKYEHLNISMQESIALHNRAREILKPYAKKPMPEFKVRELINETGIQTFPRPNGIPENYFVTISDKGAGMKYVNPQNTHTYVRIMPGKSHSPFPYQQKPYVNQRINGKSLDKNGSVVPNESPEAHIPLEEFVYRRAE